MRREYPGKKTRFRWFHALLGALALGGVLLFAALLSLKSPIPALAFNPGQNGHPTSGHFSDLKGRAGDVSFTFKQNMTIGCTGNTAQVFDIQLDYSISGGPLPAGAFVIVYLSPNNGAINSNAGGDAAGYIATVESNEISLPMAGLSGSGTLPFSITVTLPFQLDGGGVLGVIADDVSWTGEPGKWRPTKTNSIGCQDIATPTSSPTDTPTATNTPTSTPTNTATPTDTPTNTPTETPTPTNTPTTTPTKTPIPTDTPTATPIPTDTPTETPIPTDTPTETPIPTDTPTATPTDTSTPIPTDTPTATQTAAPTATETPTGTPPTATPVPSATSTPPTATPVPSATGTPPTATPTIIPTSTAVPTSTPTGTLRAAATSTPLPTAANAPLPTSTRVTQVLPARMEPTRTPVSRVLAAPTLVIRELPRTGSGPGDAGLPWPGVLGGLLAVAGLLVLFSALYRRLSDTKR